MKKRLFSKQTIFMYVGINKFLINILYADGECYAKNDI